MSRLGCVKTDRGVLLPLPIVARTDSILAQLKTCVATLRDCLAGF